MQIPPRVRSWLEPLPFPMRFSDGRVRLATVRLALMQRLWRHIPTGTLESSQVLTAYRGGDVIDIGAFHGWYTVLLAPRANPGDRLVSFEPDPEAVPVLRAMLRNLTRHFPAVEVSVVTRPVGDGRGVVASWPAGASSHPRFAEAGPGDAVPSLTVDEFVAAQRLTPRLIKVDVEGAELAVLRGMRDTLAEHRPVLMLEVHPEWQPDGVTADDVERFIRDSGYEGATFDDGSMSRRQTWRPQAARPAQA
jgi:FkbM family methyltransferase